MPQLSAEQRQEMIALSADHTQAECAERFGVSRSTVARTLKAAAASVPTPEAPFAADANLQFEPPAQIGDAGAEVFNFESDAAGDTAFNGLLDSAGLEEREEAAAAAGPEQAAPPGMDERQTDSLLHSLGINADGPHDIPAPKSRPRRRAQTPAADVEPETTMVSVPTSTEKQRALPDSVLQQKLRLLCSSFDEQLEPLLGSQAEREAFRKAIRKLKGEVLRAQLEEVHSFLVLRTSTDMCRQGLDATCAAIQHCGPYLGARTEGYVQFVQQHKMAQINPILSLAVIENFEFFRARNSPTLLICSVLTSSVAQVHAANTQLAQEAKAKVASAQVPQNFSMQ
jgi:hypothetical protein